MLTRIPPPEGRECSSVPWDGAWVAPVPPGTSPVPIARRGDRGVRLRRGAKIAVGESGVDNGVDNNVTVEVTTVHVVTQRPRERHCDCGWQGCV